MRSAKISAAASCLALSATDHKRTTQGSQPVAPRLSPDPKLRQPTPIGATQLSLPNAGRYDAPDQLPPTDFLCHFPPQAGLSFLAFPNAENPLILLNASQLRDFRFDLEGLQSAFDFVIVGVFGNVDLTGTS